MKRIIASLLFFAIFSTLTSFSQTTDCSAIKDFSPALQVQTAEVCRYVCLTSDQQVSLAKGIQKYDKAYVKALNADSGLLTSKSAKKLEKSWVEMLRSVMTEQQVQQYYRGLFDSEANAEGIKIANALQKKYGLTDQNWKFIRIAMYKLALEQRVANKLIEGKEAKKHVAKLKKDLLQTIVDKGGISVDPDAMTVTVICEFDPNHLER